MRGGKSQRGRGGARVVGVERERCNSCVKLVSVLEANVAMDTGGAS